MGCHMTSSLIEAPYLPQNYGRKPPSSSELKQGSARHSTRKPTDRQNEPMVYWKNISGDTSTINKTPCAVTSHWQSLHTTTVIKKQLKPHHFSQTTESTRNTK